ncbi:Phosphotransferase enzyme family protein [Brevibacterium sandarakinum]|uniref:Phosphotransferase enzyme family protein n=1 Tax=Brevibacterium sandarakinum TaxID=629680 RepID=A0A1H1TY22_BRESA|nr:phosphotransferase [Brevibacterium sandarakinum]SDS65093.1 Phosphotransferase enzyme family protein [Brevibacterium sandarakinum]
MTTVHEADEATAAFAGLPYVTELRSGEALSRRLGFAVEPVRIRVKPGRSAIVSWKREEKGRLAEDQDWGWSAVVTGADKLANIRRRAARRNETVTVHECSEPRSAGATGSVLISGSVRADSKLEKEIARATRELTGADDQSGELETIGYNPGRRVLLKHTRRGSGTAELVRIGTGSQQHLVETAALWADWGLPTLSAEALGSRGTAVRSPWWGIGDLETHPDLAVAEEVGVIIAELHRHTPAEVGHRARVSPLEQAAETATVVSQLLPEAGSAVADIVRTLHHRIRLEPGPGAAGGAEAGSGDRAIHGDLSPDQVLVGHSECRIIDLDRAGVGPTGMDLGRWVASCRRRADAHAQTLETGFLGGYRSAGGADVDVEAWAAWAMLVTVLEPWRTCRADWRRATLQIIGAAQDSLAATGNRVS